jgi:uncharacterized protein (DUF488 family)
MRVFTIGFTHKSAAEFFGLLHDAGVKRVVDIRLNNISQLAGFTKRDDLAYFLDALADIRYDHVPLLAPDQGLIDRYRKQGLSYPKFAAAYTELMRERKVESVPEAKLHAGDCLMCSEVSAAECHRGVLVDYLTPHYKGMKVRHLT